MRYLLFCLIAFTAFLVGCEDNELADPECTIKGRWIIEGLNESTLYEFTDSLRYSIYSTEPGVFGTIADAIPNPHEYYFRGDSLVIDLNFDNFSVTLPTYKCDCNVVELVNGDGASILYKEDYNYTDCEE